jgi:phosphopentomutase
MALAALDTLGDGGFMFVNLVDFDTEYGHRRDVPGYAACLEAFDRQVPGLEAKLRDSDLLVVTADHGNDPTWRGADHTRECAPLLLTGPAIMPAALGRRSTFADIGATVASHLGLPPTPAGTPIVLRRLRPRA